MPALIEEEEEGARGSIISRGAMEDAVASVGRSMPYYAAQHYHFEGPPADQ